MTNTMIIGIVGSWAAIIGIIVSMVRYFPSQKLFDTERENMRAWVKDVDDRAEKRHKELTKKLEHLEDLIRNGGHDKGRIYT